MQHQTGQRGGSVRALSFALAIGVTACSSGSSSGSSSAASASAAAGSASSMSAGPSTVAVATAGQFCTLSNAARLAGQAIDTSSTDTAVLRTQVAAALAATKAAAAVAPGDYADIAKNAVAQEDKIVALLEKYDYNFTAALGSAEGKALIGSADYTAVKTQSDAYLQTHCDLKPTDATTGGGAGVVLSPGDAGIRQLFQLLQIGGQLDITDDQIDCLVDALSGKISDSDLKAIGSNGSVTDAGTAAFVEALSTCGVVPTVG